MNNGYKSHPRLLHLMNAMKLLRNGHYGIFFSELKTRLRSESYSFGLKRDLDKKFEAPKAKIELKIRELKKEDVPLLLENSVENPINPRIIASQQAHVNANIPTCYVAVTENDDPCYMQWLFTHDKNDVIEEHFEGIFPRLIESEALLEGAYGRLSYRGLRVMPAAMARIAEKAAEKGVSRVITFVDVSNIPSLKGCMRAGFEPYILRKEKMMLFKRSISFHEISDQLMEEYRQMMGISPEPAHTAPVKEEKVNT